MKVLFTIIIIYSVSGILSCGGGSESSSTAHPLVRIGFKHDVIWTKRSALENANLQLNVRQDFTTMASLGAKTVKLVLLPSETGLNYHKAGGASFNLSDFNASLGEALMVLRELRSLGMEAVVAFMVHGSYLEGPNGFYPNNQPNWHQYSYLPLGDESSKSMADDLLDWQNRFIEAIESSSEANVVKNYLVLTETIVDGGRNGLAPEWQSASLTMIEVLLRNTLAPKGKLGADMFWPEETSILSSISKSVGREVDFSEVHSYPAIGYNNDLLSAFEIVRTFLPSAMVTLGEYGVDYCDVQASEDAQRSLFLSSIDDAIDAKALEIMNWGLWDSGVSSRRDCELKSRWGLGFEEHAPRDVYGLIVDLFSLIPNSDFEQPELLWRAGEGTILSFTNEVAATGRVSLKAESDNSVVRACSPFFEASEGRIAFNAYVRGSSAKLLISFVDRDEEIVSSSSFAPTSSDTFHSIQHLGEPSYFSVARSGEYSICFEASGEAPYLYIDAISSQRIP